MSDETMDTMEPEAPRQPTSEELELAKAVLEKYPLAKPVADLLLGSTVEEFALHAKAVHERLEADLAAREQQAKEVEEGTFDFKQVTAETYKPRVRPKYQEPAGDQGLPATQEQKWAAFFGAEADEVDEFGEGAA
jgi:hypothetical protein